MFAMFTDRDGKSQLMSLAESSLDPLSRTTRFMLTRRRITCSWGRAAWPHHPADVGADAADRPVRRRAAGGRHRPATHPAPPQLLVQRQRRPARQRDLDQRATYFANGLKGRAKEDSWEDHRALHGTYAVDVFENGVGLTRNVPARNAMNEMLRDWYIKDATAGVERWNRILERGGLSDRLYVPSRRFNRKIGIYADQHFTRRDGPSRPSSGRRASTSGCRRPTTRRT